MCDAEDMTANADEPGAPMTSTVATIAYTKAEAKVSDGGLAKLYAASYAADAAREGAIDAVHRAAGDTKEYMTRHPYWKMNLDDALGAAAGTPALADYSAKTTACQVAARAIREHEATHWEAHGRWQRFFLVPGGHIHSSTRCSSLHITTRIGWLPNLSGETEADAVGEHGAMLCTKCFPSAPTEYTRGKVDPSICTAARLPVSRRGRYGTCECGYVGALTTTGAMRKHKVPVAERADA